MRLFLAAYRVLRRVLLFPIARLLTHDIAVLKAAVRRRTGRDSGVVACYAGKRAVQGETWAVFVIWQPGSLPWYLTLALEALAAARINVITVVNQPLAKEAQAHLEKLSTQVMLRDNSGFDIGGYRDATRWLATRSPARTIYMNDSVYYFGPALIDLFERLRDTTAAVAGTFETWAHGYPVQSFCFSISRYLFEHTDIQRFWEDYLPVSSRLWTVRRGELGFSRRIMERARTIEVIYSPSVIARHTASLSPAELTALANRLSIDVRPEGSDLTGLDPSALAGHIQHLIAKRSQAHTGALLYVDLANCPMLKRDLVYRGKFQAHEVEETLGRHIPPDALRMVSADLRRKGAGSSFRGWKRLLFDQWII